MADQSRGTLKAQHPLFKVEAQAEIDGVEMGVLDTASHT
ncbi:hypothetical protein AGI3411_03727 [Achromobacter agilis]|uniref:Uncharacterized protein n=1 Tax=Achromobacter agilis TaxID=1353888 RepID=A0A446CLA3_9BURK|nr:hypothetical protein AGI3411_03727 [Achromobacter agilis]